MSESIAEGNMKLNKEVHGHRYPPVKLKHKQGRNFVRYKLTGIPFTPESVVVQLEPGSSNKFSIFFPYPDEYLADMGDKEKDGNETS